jgi:hypothetical protein
MAMEWRVLPFRVDGGCLYLAGPEPPTDEVEKRIRRFTRLDLRFQLITPGNFARLQREFLRVSARRGAVAARRYVR